jgi:ABC-2 type transport system permease protein
MRLGHGIAVVVEAARLGFKHTLGERLLLLGSFLLYAAVMLAYSAVFHAVGTASLAGFGLSQANLIWYMGVTELVLFCTPTFQFREFQHEIRSGDIDMFLVRPCPLWIVKLGDGTGRFWARLLVLSIPCLTLTSFVAGGSFPGFGRMLGALLSAVLTSPLLTASLFMLGASCLWLRHAEPAYWVWHKCLFLLGGLLWPLALYPAAVRHFAWITPFPAMAATPAQWGLPGGEWWLAAAFLHQLFWVAAILFMMAKTGNAVLLTIQRGETP